MQLLSAYLLESPVLDGPGLQTRFEGVRGEIGAWLAGKGVADPSSTSGDFASLTKDGSGSFVREETLAHGDRLEQTTLEEFTRAGQIFTTHLSAASRNGRLRIYCTLSVTNAESVVAPLPVDPRCPSIVRALLTKWNDWCLNNEPIPAPTPMRVEGAEAARGLAASIRNLARPLPIVVVSEIEGEQLWTRTAEELAFDLAGLAQVAVIDDEATWALSDEIGKLNSCYRGAVRLYWPPRLRSDGETHFNSTVWTASVLLSSDRDGKGLSRLRSTLRRLLMSTAALSITPPPAIRDIQDAHSRVRLEDLERRADPNSEELATARRYAKENQELKAKIDQLQSELAKAAARADVAEHAVSQLKAPPLADQDDETLEESTEPVAGDVRFYKKTHSKGAYDVLVEVDDCGHTSWQASNKADKAKKGLERLLGRNDWKNLQHCGTCTGGGMWKVRW